MVDTRTGISVDKVKKVLLNSGYETLESSVHGKNQTRFTHLILNKVGKKYFCKVNNTNEVYSSQVNETQIRIFENLPDKIKFLAPIDTIEDSDNIFHIYPYVDQLPVSNESKKFKDFLVSEGDIDFYLKQVLVAISYVERQKLITSFESNRHKTVEETVIRILKQLEKSTPYAVEFLQYLLSEGKDLNDYRLSITDIQPQNMFWDEHNRSLILFDLEHISPQKKYYDHAKFCALLWVVYGREEYAKRFVELMFGSTPQKEKVDAYRYFRYHMTLDSLVYYGDFKEADARKRNIDMMRWIRRDLLAVANS